MVDVSRMINDVQCISDLMRVLETSGTDEDLLADMKLVTQLCSATVVTRYAMFLILMDVKLN